MKDNKAAASQSKLGLFKRQRFDDLKDIFKILDTFAIQSVSPDMMEDYEEFKNYLLKIYSNNAASGCISEHAKEEE